MSKKQPAKQTAPVKPSAVNNNNLIYGLLIVLSIVFVIICMNNKFIQDDAYISFRYVENFVNGNGLVFNIGEKVEGYTNLLWVLLLSVFVFMKMSIESVSQILSVIFGIVVLIMTYYLSGLFPLNDEAKLSKKVKVDSNASVKYFDLIAPLFLVFTSSFIFWSVSGMETTMFISFVLCGIYFYLKDRKPDKLNYQFPLFILLATLTRPEGMYFFGLIMIHKFFFAIKEKKAEGLKEFFSKNNILSYLVYIIPVILYFLIRYSYYGYLFPNTYYAKAGFSSEYLNTGLDYFTKFLTSYLIYGIVLIAPLYLFKKRECFFELTLFYLLIVSFILYVISVGGDVLKQGRFFLPVLPLIYILFAKFLNEMYYKFRASMNGSVAGGIIAVACAVICIFYYTSQKENLDSDIQGENGLVQKMKLSGAWFKTKQQGLGRPLNVAATTIGAVSYFAGPQVNVIDILGLTDKEVAHNPKRIPEISDQSIGWKERNYNADYIMSRDPDYVYFSTGVKPSAYGERALYTVEEFMKYYYPYYISDRANNYSDVVYRRKSEDEVKDKPWEFPGNPNYKPSYVNMFNQGMNTSRNKANANQTLNEFKQALEIGPSGFGYPYMYIADILLGQGKKEQAIENYRKAVEINEDNVLANYQLYQLYSEKGDTANAQKSLDLVKKYDAEILR